jgi:CheY-like chemotaxis protein
LIRAREKQSGRHIPIVAMTAYAMKGDRERCLEAGMDCYISKPIRAKQLFETLEMALQLGSPPQRPIVDVDARRPNDEICWPVALEAVNGDQHLLSVVVKTALEETPRLVAAIRQAIDDRDTMALRLTAHTLRGSIRCFGDGPFAQCALRLERMGQQASLDDAREAFAALESEVGPFCGALENYLKR